ncbi:hypothetical protein SNEBB_000114 [Seison nebaliae]|nr:hypothetical protein SNEBB_000114 [Seison nebaliae]
MQNNPNYRFWYWQPPETVNTENGERSRLTSESSKSKANIFGKVDHERIRAGIYKSAIEQEAVKSAPFHFIPPRKKNDPAYVPLGGHLEPLAPLTKSQKFNEPKAIQERERLEYAKKGVTSSKVETTTEEKKITVPKPMLELPRGVNSLFNAHPRHRLMKALYDSQTCDVATATLRRPPLLSNQAIVAPLKCGPVAERKRLDNVLAQERRKRPSPTLMKALPPKQTMTDEPKGDVSKMFERNKYNGITNLLEVEKIVRNATQPGFFLYLTHRAAKTNVQHNFYNLATTEYGENGDQNEFFTISKSGVTHYSKSAEITFTPLDEWITEFKSYSELSKIRTFEQFRMWKMFIVWRNNVRHKKIIVAQRALKEKLFTLNPVLRPALLNAREMCYRIGDMSMLQIEDEIVYEINEFLLNQTTQLTTVKERLDEFRKLMVDIIFSACRTALYEAGFTPDTGETEDSKMKYKSSMNDSATSIRSKPSATQKKEHFDVDLYGEMPEKMSYTQQAKKRYECHRLVNFIRLIDYIINNTLHLLGLNSLRGLLTHFAEHLIQTPPIDALELGPTALPWDPNEPNCYYAFLKEHKMDNMFREPYTLKMTKAYKFGASILNFAMPDEEISTIRHRASFLEEIPKVMMNANKKKSSAKPSSVKQQPMMLALQNQTKDMFHELRAREDRNIEMLSPLFSVELGIGKNTVITKPSEQEYVAMVRKIVEQVKHLLCGLECIVTDDIFIPFTQPIINQKREDPIFEKGPSLLDMLSEDVMLMKINEALKDSITISFGALGEFSSTFKNYVTWYTQNEEINSEEYEKSYESSNDTEFMQVELEKYNQQIEHTKLIIAQRSIGIFSIECEPIRRTLDPSPKRILMILSMIIPDRAKKLTESLIQEAQDGIMKLEATMEQTKDYVDALIFLDNVQERVESMENEMEIVKEMYDLIDQYRIDVVPEEIALYSTLNGTINNFHNVIDKSLAERDENVKHLVKYLSKDIEELDEEVKQLRRQGEQPSLLDVTANPTESKNTLKELIAKIDDLQKLAHLYRDYQRRFKIEVRKYEELEQVASELKLKELLWNSIEEFKFIVNEWNEKNFKELNPEEIIATLNIYNKYLYQMEKGLPPSTLVAELKQQVERMKSQLPVITDMRNPNLQKRHWSMIYEKLNYQPEKDRLTLKILTELNAFDFAEEMQEISGMASSEASLEAILKKVEDAWKTAEFIVVQHKGRDVFILGGTDDIQQLLDDSIINIGTIASSKHVGPIAGRVQVWQDQLDLFGRTLEQWLICQRSWLYLELIFAAPDIARQLPVEAKMFSQVDRSWKEIMRRVSKVPTAMRAATLPGVLEAMQNNNTLLEQIMKCLENYLESKRVTFPRFYFLSNDELLEILAQTRNPQAVQPHLRKCFDAINRLEFAKLEKVGEGEQVVDEAVVYTNDILSMISPEKEVVSLGKSLKARGNVEEWLGKVEEAMFLSIKKLIKASAQAFLGKSLQNWVKEWPSQVILTVSQTQWCSTVTKILEKESTTSLKQLETISFKRLHKLAAIIREKLPPLVRATLCALITIDVHARDIITEMNATNVDKIQDFTWQKQLRYYFDATHESTVVKQSSSQFWYAHEYLGASPRLVITPLTDRCYLCLMGALQLDLGGAPAGPAGTGKTETTKDLAKALAIQCVVFNCSESIDYRLMGKFFSGLAQSGAWCCFDEFNRIDIEVLSVIAQQLITIRNAKTNKLQRFIFEGKEIKLIPTCATFITMNPGYAGRTELPDNLKALFRPISMMVPDYRLIAEVILYSEGFENSKILAQKMTQMYKLCSEQLSQQDHYDFGMRAVKSVLVMAGTLKRENPNILEDLVLIRALRDSNLPKFLKADAALFHAIVHDLFPGTVLPEHDYGVLETHIKAAQVKQKLQNDESQISKVIQLHETLIVRHGVMLVGPSGGGKTSVLNVLAMTLGDMFESGQDHPSYQPVISSTLNPKSITMGELYGEIDALTLEWRDGLMASIVRRGVALDTTDHYWVICDGPVDALWIENMNTVLDDNKMLCLANSERIKLTNNIKMIFEVEDLAVASPATVSRCGMVYIDPNDLKWSPYVRSWLQDTEYSQETKDYLLEMFNSYVEKGLQYVNKNCVEAIPQVEIAKVVTITNIFVSVYGKNDPELELSKKNSLIATVFCFAFVWGLGGGINQSNWDRFDSYSRILMDDNSDMKLGTAGDLFSYKVETNYRHMEMWEKHIAPFNYSTTTPYFEMLVPTVDTLRYGYFLEILTRVNKSVLLTGNTGVGKSVIARSHLVNIAEKNNLLPIFVNFSAQTNAPRTQEIIESKFDRRKKTLLTPPNNQHLILFIDDLNMPKPDTYGSQPPIELLRQIQDFGGFYDREKLFWKDVKGATLCAACAPPGGGRNKVTARFLRHFSIFNLAQPAEFSLKHIFKSILNGFLQPFPTKVRTLSAQLVDSVIEIFERMSTDLLPTPDKSHYIFNLRDLSKCIQGILQVTPETCSTPEIMLKLFFHETQRIFHDRLINDEDKNYFYNILADMSSKYFREPIEDPDIFRTDPVVFGDFMVMTPEERYYELIPDLNKLKSIIEDYQQDYNLAMNSDSQLVFFRDAILHIARIARMIRLERGNSLLVGVGGTGKQSLTSLAAFICGHKCFKIELSRGYNYQSFHEDLKILYERAGVNNETTVFIFTDTQIVCEEFLEDINNMLNSGEVPNLFPNDEYEKIVNSCRGAAKEIGIVENDRDGIFQFFINRVRNNLHIVLCMSPVGDSFRSRCRMFPSLVNCCVIDWFTVWPSDALYSVAETFFSKMTFDKSQEHLGQALGKMCVDVHESVTQYSEEFYDELHRKYYTTPTSYLELIQFYCKLVNEHKQKIRNQKMKVERGLEKLAETNILVAEMQIELTALEPELIKRTKDTEILMKKLAVDQEKADVDRKAVKEDEAVAMVKAEETRAIAEDAQRDVDAAQPAIDEAKRQLDALQPSDIAEIRVYTKPPELVMTVMETICILLGRKADWPTAKQLLGDTKFLSSLQHYDAKSQITEAIYKKVKPYFQIKNFTAEEVGKVSHACKSMLLWVRAIVGYSRVLKDVAPKEEKLKKAEAELKIVMDQLKEKQDKLAAVEATIKSYQIRYEKSLIEKRKLETSMNLTKGRLSRASKLTTSLADEQVRWKSMIVGYDDELVNVSGNIFIASACIAYFGAFTSSYRKQMVQKWIDECINLKIPISANTSLQSVLGDNFVIRQWTMDGLPLDDFSIENGLLVEHGRRWPLMIDPQDQANRWIKTKEIRNGLVVLKLSDPKLLQKLENCVRIGLPLLIEQIDETLDPALEPILLRKTFMSGGRLLIRLGDADIDYNTDFRFYMTTKLANPHYLPEICIKVTIINFAVTNQGLEDQILSEIVQLERPDLEQQKNELITNIDADKTNLKQLEDRTLKLLFESEGNILDNEELIETLNNSKITSIAIKHRLAAAETTEATIVAEREKYRSVAKRASVMYFVVADLANIDSMYQYSLKYFKQLFKYTVVNSKKSKDLNTRLDTLNEETSKTIYKNVSRGLFEKDKLAFSFLLCCRLLLMNDAIHEDEWDFLLRGMPQGLKLDIPPFPADVELLIDEEYWLKIWMLQIALPDIFTNIKATLLQGPVNVKFCREIEIELNDPNIGLYADQPEDEEPPCEISELSTFQQLILIKTFAPNHFVHAVSTFVGSEMGELFITAPSMELAKIFDDISTSVPLVFILSTGSDPMAALQRFAVEMNMNKNLTTISLGQGQGPIAEKMMLNGVKNGQWVFLQNCHLAKSWMIHLEDLIKEFGESTTIHEDYRLFLSSMPDKSFPVYVLQNSVKVTNEPPKGLRANTSRAFNEISKQFFEDNLLGNSWRKMIFGICFFHAIIQERKKFGALGWNIKYDFNASDRECALLNLELFCGESEIPWDALIYITGEITYGGRVTDFWDQRCLRTILRTFFHPNILEENYKFSESGIYYPPNFTELQEYKDYINQFPLIDDAEIFGMNLNANYMFQKQETETLVGTLLEIQPRSHAQVGGKSQEDIIYDLCAAMLAEKPQNLSIENAPKFMNELDDKNRQKSLTTVLLQEIDRYNKLIEVISSSLIDLQKAIRGLMVMSESLEKMYRAIDLSQVPQLWKDCSYPSLKKLGGWYRDFQDRINFMNYWIRLGEPKCYWLPGIFFPQGFLTAVLQTHARQYSLPIDKLSFIFTVSDVFYDQQEANENVKTRQPDQPLAADKALPTIDDGVLIHGLYMDACKWDIDVKSIVDCSEGEMNPMLPVLHMEPTDNFIDDPNDYIAPLYKTAERAGTLSTTGHSTNFVVPVNLQSQETRDYWIMKGAALLCQLSE